MNAFRANPFHRSVFACSEVILKLRKGCLNLAGQFDGNECAYRFHGKAQLKDNSL